MARDHSIDVECVGWEYRVLEAAWGDSEWMWESADSTEWCRIHMYGASLPVFEDVFMAVE